MRAVVRRRRARATPPPAGATGGRGDAANPETGGAPRAVVTRLRPARGGRTPPTAGAVGAPAASRAGRRRRAAPPAPRRRHRVPPRSSHRSTSTAGTSRPAPDCATAATDRSTSPVSRRGSTVARAYLYWSVDRHLGPRPGASFPRQGRRHPVAGRSSARRPRHLLGSEPGFGFRADVTNLVHGNGDYRLSSFRTADKDGSIRSSTVRPSPIAQRCLARRRVRAAPRTRTRVSCSPTAYAAAGDWPTSTTRSLGLRRDESGARGPHHLHRRRRSARQHRGAPATFNGFAQPT